ncbi:hypothetical protein [Streptomyces sp. WAC00263]|uniref:hypothetical protein n=1 Tax=Streptomyces sp. WAC00263 TaxID=1917422 RepID=UPI0015EF483E|nr:hypothetical protein [Streptomyces sp. WAC00263]KAF5994537.1 hypothetical protein BOG92_024935 [Streptomyces sp. WAC00263]
MTTSSLTDGIFLADPASHDLVLPSHRVRPGVPDDRLPRFGQLVWRLSSMIHKETARQQSVNWAHCPEPLRASMMRVGWAVLNIPAPAVLLRQPGSRAVMSPRALRFTFGAWMDFARWLVKREITELAAVSAEALAEYADHVRSYGRSWHHDQRAARALTRIWGYAPFLLPQDRLVMPPWEDPAATMTDFLGTKDTPADGENRTPIVHPAVMSPLLVWSLRTVLELGPDILAAWRERQRLLDRTHQGSARGDSQKVVDYLQGLIAEGKLLPGFSGYQNGAIKESARSRGGDEVLPALNRQYIAGIVGVDPVQVALAQRRLRHRLEPGHYGPDAPLNVAITGRIGDRPWTDSLDFEEVGLLVLRLSTAALITTAYLSGMRPEEVQHLVRGCCTREDRADGTVRYKVTGRHFKGVTDDEGNEIPEGEIRPDPWIVLEFVARAIEVVEELESGDLLFSRSFSRQHRPSSEGGDAVTGRVAAKRIANFIAWANQLAVRHGRPHELIPEDPDGPVVLRRLRRTIAWFIYRQPGGRIALGVQFGHAATLIGESYAGRSKADMLELLDFEKGLALADALSEARDRLAGGESVSGPAAPRYIAAATEFENRYAGTYLGKRELRALVRNPKLQVYEDPKAFLTCNFDAFKALCDPELAQSGPSGQRTPDRSRCNLACANISRTDSQIAAVQAEIDEIDAAAEARLDPYPIARREQQRRAALVQIAERHRATAIPASPAREKTP